MSNLIKTEELSKEMICEAVREYCNSKSLSQHDLAVKSGVSGATINKVLNKKWDDISEPMWRKLWNVVSSGKEALLFDTRDHEIMRQICEISRKKQIMIGLTGDTGVGKTTSLKLLSRQKNTFYVVYDKTMKAKTFFAMILREMGIAFESNIYDMVNRIADELNVMSKPLLIVDEAGKITHNVMLYMHVLRDKTISNCGIVLAGMPYFKTNLEKNSNKQKEGYAEFHRRINLWQELLGLRRNEIEYICKKNGIKEAEEIQNFYRYKRFGDLMNKILLYQIDNIVSTLND